MKKVLRVAAVAIMIIAAGFMLSLNNSVSATLDRNQFKINVNSTELKIDEKNVYGVKVPYYTKEVYVTVDGYHLEENGIIPITENKTKSFLNIINPDNGEKETFTLYIIREEKTKEDSKKEFREKVEDIKTRIILWLISSLLFFVIALVPMTISYLVRKIKNRLK